MGPFDRYQLGEFERSWSGQLDKVGMQPHAREYLEDEMLCKASYRRFEVVDGQEIDYCEGIQFSGSP